MIIGLSHRVVLAPLSNQCFNTVTRWSVTMRTKSIHLFTTHYTLFDEHVTCSVGTQKNHNENNTTGQKSGFEWTGCADGYDLQICVLLNVLGSSSKNTFYFYHYTSPRTMPFHSIIPYTFGLWELPEPDKTLISLTTSCIMSHFRKT